MNYFYVVADDNFSFPAECRRQRLASVSFPHIRTDLKWELVSTGFPTTVEKRPNAAMQILIDANVWEKTLFSVETQHSEEALSLILGTRGYIVSFQEALAKGQLLQPTRSIKVGISDFAYSFAITPSLPETVYLRDKVYSQLEIVNSRRAGLYSLLLNLSVKNPSVYLPNKIMVDPLADLSNMDMAASSDYFFNKFDDGYVVEVAKGKSKATLVSKSFDIEVTKCFLAGYGCGDPFKIFISNDDGAQWVVPVMNVDSLTDEVVFSSTPSKFKVKMEIERGSLPFNPFLMNWGFIYA